MHLPHPRKVSMKLCEPYFCAKEGQELSQDELPGVLCWRHEKSNRRFVIHGKINELANDPEAKYQIFGVAPSGLRSSFSKAKEIS